KKSARRSMKSRQSGGRRRLGLEVLERRSLLSVSAGDVALKAAASPEPTVLVGAQEPGLQSANMFSAASAASRYYLSGSDLYLNGELRWTNVRKLGVHENFAVF